MSRTRIKICGITRRSDAECAVAAGADALGVVLYADSKRRVSLEQAAAVLADLPSQVERVGLFVNAPAEFVSEACAAVPLSLLQFHGSEEAEACARHGRPWMKAVGVGQGTDVAALLEAYAAADAVLLDTWVAGGGGGTGKRFDWSLVPEQRPAPLVLAGGLSAENVEEAIRLTRPCAVDVSSGVEAAPGVKDPARIEAFVAAVRAADAAIEGG